MLIKTLLTKSERYLLRNQRQFVLTEAQDTVERESSDENILENILENIDMDSKYFQILIDGTRLEHEVELSQLE